MRSPTLLVLRTEIRNLLRDRRAFLVAVVLPMLLYPALFWGMDRLEERSEDSLDRRTVLVAHDLSALEPEIAGALLDRLYAPDLGLELELAPEELVRRLADEEAPDAALLGGYQAVCVARLARPGDVPELDVYVDRSETLSDEAGDRLRRVARELREGRIRRGLLATTGGVDPAAALVVETRDLALPGDAAGRELGKLLPLIAVLLLVSGGSFAALDAFAGERESGTLETLLVQPVPARDVATGKFLAVLATGLFAFFGNALSLHVCQAGGLLGETAARVEPGRLVVGLLLFLPTAVLLSAILCLVCARARSFREGQHYVFPVILVTAGPAALATLDQIELDPVLALIPITGPTLALRDALVGRLTLLPTLLMLVASAGWAALALSGLARTLDAERLLATRDTRSEAGARKLAARRALSLGLVACLAVYLVGGRLQAANPVWGLVATLTLLLPVLTVLAVRLLAGETSASRALGLRAAGDAPLSLGKGLGIALLAAPALTMLVSGVFELQSRFLPLPPLSFPSELLDLDPLLRVLVMAVLPGIFEELLFRGALLHGLRRDLPAGRAVLLQALLFGLVHASAHRLLPTALVGIALGWLRIGTGSLLPTILLHASYNAILVLELPDQPLWNTPVALLLGALALGLALRGVQVARARGR